MNHSSDTSLLRRAVTSSVTIFALVVLVYGFATRFHLRLSYDGQFYLGLAKSVQQGSFSEFLSTHQANFTIVAFPSLLALVRSLFGTHWEAVMLLLNVLCAALTGVLLLKVVQEVTDSIAAAAAAILFYVGCYDIFAWVGWLMTDHLFTVASLAVFLWSIRGIMDQVERRLGDAGAATLIATLTRPVGILLAPLAIVTEAVFVRNDTSENRRRVWTVFAVGLLAAMLVHAYFFHDMQRWPTDFMRPKLQEYAAREQAGEVVWDRPETAHARPASMLGHVAIEADRFVRFFQVTVVGFSRAHNAYAILYYIPLYGLALIGILDAFLGVDERRRAVVHVTLLWILSMAALCAVTILDFDWRYRMPLLPQLIFLAACGAEAVGRRVAVLRPQPRFAAR